MRLERRLSKVKALLELRESELQRLVVAGEVDSGVASIYREAQGLQAESELGQRKREMMALIFEANQELQRKLASGPNLDTPGDR
jgi:16S rRNA G1207 methylase RsmC